MCELDWFILSFAVKKMQSPLFSSWSTKIPSLLCIPTYLPQSVAGSYQTCTSLRNCSPKLNLKWVLWRHWWCARCCALVWQVLYRSSVLSLLRKHCRKFVRRTQWDVKWPWSWAARDSGKQGYALTSARWRNRRDLFSFLIAVIYLCKGLL